jgi:hypothetical protein
MDLESLLVMHGSFKKLIILKGRIYRRTKSLLFLKGGSTDGPDAGPEPEEAHPLPHERALPRRNRKVKGEACLTFEIFHRHNCFENIGLCTK